MTELPLLDTKVLIVEDDYWQADECRYQLAEAGAEVVAMAGAVSSALATLESVQVDVGLLDVNLGGRESFDVARGLIARGVPVLFLTGYEPDYLPDDLATVPVITKPAPWRMVIQQLVNLHPKRVST